MMRLWALVKQVRSVYERVGFDDDPKTAVPPRWMFWDNDALDEWFEQRKGDKP